MSDIKEHLDKKLEKLGEDIDAQIKKANEQSENAGEVAENLKNELDSMTKSYEKLQEQVDDMNSKQSKIISGEKAASNWKSIISEKLNGFEGDMRHAVRKGLTFDMEGKSFATNREIKEVMSSSNTITGRIPQFDLQPGIVVEDPERVTHVRSLLSVGQTNSDTISYYAETLFNNAAAIVAEGATKPQSDFDLEEKTDPVRKIATHIRISEELLTDIPQMRSHILARLPKKIRIVEDAQLLYGTGTGNEIEGLTTAASAYADVLADSDVNRFDVLSAAVQQVRQDEFVATGILVNPSDWFAMARGKGSDGHYLFPDQVRFGGQPPRVMGVPVLQSTAITEGEFLVGDFSSQATQLFDRMQSQVRFYEQDQDNAITNQVTVVAEERIALAIYRPSALVYGDFATALAQGSA